MLFLINALTVGRLILGLAFPLIPAQARLAVVLAGALSDLVDGCLSRWLRATSDFGRIVDPIADKVFVLSVVLTLCYEGRITAWELALLSLRDLAVLLIGLVLFARHGGRWPRIEARPIGKAATALQFVFLLSVLTFTDRIVWLFWLTVIVTVLAAADLVVAAVRRASVSLARRDHT